MNCAFCEEDIGPITSENLDGVLEAHYKKSPNCGLESFVIREKFKGQVDAIRKNVLGDKA